MATEFKEIESYVTTKWYNYNPPSIDQDNLLHIEKNIELNRNTINEIIRRLGVVPAGGTSSDDQKIYDTSIYDTLLDFRDKIKKLQDEKLDKATYEKERGDFSSLQGGTDLVSAINNRLRKDTDDVSQYSYTFKALTLTDKLTVGTTSIFTGNVDAKAKVSVAGLLSANGGIETTTFKASSNANITGQLGVTGKTTLNNGLVVKNGGNLTGTLTVDNLIVTGSVKVGGENVVLSNNGEITCANKITAGAGIRTKGAFHSTQEFIEFHWGQNPAHCLYVHGGSQSLGGGDAFIQTVN